MSVGWMLMAALCLALSGLPAALLGAKSRHGAALGAALNVLACGLAGWGMAEANRQFFENHY